MGRYLDILRRFEAVPQYDQNDINDQSPPPPPPDCTFGRFGRFGRTCQELESRCPDLVEVDRWQLAVRDAHSFLPVWGEKADALGWTARELFGLHPVPERPTGNYQRLARYDSTGLVWLLQGRRVVALTAETAAIQTAIGRILTYRKNNKPAFGPVGDSLDDFGRAV
jgi:hypothetical protein